MVTLLTQEARSESLGFSESQLFRFSSYEKVEDWLLPLYSYPAHSFPKFRFNLSTSMHPEVFDVISDVRSKDQPRIAERIENSYLRPYDASAKLSLGYRYKRLSQSLSYSYGAVVLVKDPVFPALEGTLFEDYLASTSFDFRNKKHKIRFVPKLTYGQRRVVRASFSALQLVAEKPDTKLKNQPWRTVVDLSGTMRWYWDKFDILGEVNSLPIVNDFSYWDVSLGIRSKNLLKEKYKLLKGLKAGISFSPLYAGDYPVQRTLRTSLAAQFSKKVSLDVFTQDEFSLGFLLSLNYKYFDFSFFSNKKYYDEFRKIGSRQYGFSLSGKF